MLLCALSIGQTVHAQTPELVGWHTKKPFQVSFDNAFQKAKEAIGASTLDNKQTHDGWLVTGNSDHLRAAISCVQVAEGVMINVQVAAANNHETDALIMRDFLKNFLLSSGLENPSSGFGAISLAVVRGPTVRTKKVSYRPVEPITVEFSNLPAERTDEWITVVPYDYAAGKFRQWKYTGKKENGSLEFGGLTRGRYEVRYHYSNGDDEIRARHTFMVE